MQNATFMGPKGLLWSSGRKQLLVADFFNHRIRGIAYTNKTAATAISPSSSSSAADKAEAVKRNPPPPPARDAVREIVEKARRQRQQQQRFNPAHPAPPPLLSSSSWQAPPAPPAGKKVRVMLWTGHSGPYHDHFVNGKQVAAQLIASGQVSVELPCAVDETEPCENVFADPNLKSKYDVVLVNADTYENPLRGVLTGPQWTGLFDFVKSGGGFFALHTASVRKEKKEKEKPAPFLSCFLLFRFS